MTARFLSAICLPTILALTAAPLSAQTTAGATQASASRIPERPVRRDIPMTRMIQRAFVAGTRDSTGRPGRNYWQLWNDYKINASLDPTTSIVTWFTGNRTFNANLDFGGRAITRITLDPNGRFPDRDASDNVWPREVLAPPMIKVR